jgi:hypothetical protein
MARDLIPTLTSPLKEPKTRTWSSPASPRMNFHRVADPTGHRLLEGKMPAISVGTVLPVSS